MLATFKREAKYIGSMLRMLKSVKDVDAGSDRLLADELEMRVDAFGANIAFIEGEREWTFDQTEDYANRVAGWCEANGINKPLGICCALVRIEQARRYPSADQLSTCGKSLSALRQY
jgi:hypothetical protein